MQTLEIKLYEEHLQFVEEFKRSINTFKSQPLKIIINSEGTDLENILIEKQNFIDWLNNFCNDHGISKDNITIETGNLIQSKEKWTNIEIKNNLLPFLSYQNFKCEEKQIEKMFSCFVGSDRWFKFILSNWVWKHYREECFQTYWYDGRFGFKKKVYEYLTLDEINEFKRQLPLYINTKEKIKKHTKGYIDWQDTYPLLEFYKKIIVDIVYETGHLGNMFSPDEKIGRPLATQSAFIVYGPKHFLKNLKRIGFKTFDSVWNELYDEFEGIERIEEIKKLITTLSKRDKSVLSAEIKSIVEHNKILYDQLTANTVGSLLARY